jgi:hypothetical protein
VPAWLESLLRPTSELPLDVVDEDEETTCSARNRTAGRDGLVAGWLETSWRGTRAMVMSSSDGYEASIGGSGQKGFPFMAAAGCNGHLNQLMNLVVAAQSSTMVSP